MVALIREDARDALRWSILHDAVAKVVRTLHPTDQKLLEFFYTHTPAETAEHFDETEDTIGSMMAEVEEKTGFREETLRHYFEAIQHPLGSGVQSDTPPSVEVQPADG
jgi:hypothetical protein